MHTKEGTHKHAATKKGNTARKKKKRGPETRENRPVNDSKPSTRAIWICIALDFGGTPPILHQETLDDAKVKVEDATGLRSTNEKLLKRVGPLDIPPRLKDHMGCILKGKINCVSFRNDTPRGHILPFGKMKKNIEILESKQLMCLDCENNGRALAWETARNIIYGARQLRGTGLRCTCFVPSKTTTARDYAS